MRPIPSIDYIRILPEIILIVFGTIVMMADPLFDDHNDRKSLGVVSAIGDIADLKSSNALDADWTAAGRFPCSTN